MVRLRTLATLLLAGWVCLTPMVPAQPQSRPTEDGLDSLLAQLADESWQVRQHAQQVLTQRGASIAPRLLAAVAATRDEEVRTRLQAVLRQIEEQRSTGPSLITLQLRGASPQQVFAEISRQAHAELRPVPGDLWTARSWPRIDLEVHRQPFWVVLRDLCAHYGVAPASSGRDWDMLIGESPSGGLAGKAPVSISGPFMMVVSQINTYRSVDLNQPRNTSRNTSLQLQVFVEPKVRVLQGASSASLLEAVDEKGNSLITPGPRHEGLHSGGTWLWHVHVPLMTRADLGRRLVRLSGEVRLVIQTHSQTAEILDVLSARDVSRTVAGRTFRLKEVSQTGDAYTVHVIVQRGGWSENEMGLLYPNNSFRLLDAAGRPLRIVSPPVPGGGGDPIELHLQFQRSGPGDSEAAGPPAKLVWEVPLEHRDVLVPFEFTNLPLP